VLAPTYIVPATVETVGYDHFICDKKRNITVNPSPAARLIHKHDAVITNDLYNTASYFAIENHRTCHIH
jgi:hypothetical protein